jgi:hypothetical protein
MYKARFTKDGQERMGIPAGTVVEYESIHPLGLVVLGITIDGKKTGHMPVLPEMTEPLN